MKIYKFTMLAALIAAGLSSCSDDEEKNPGPQYKLSSYLEAAGFVIDDTVIFDGRYEFGLRFYPTVAGRIDNILVRLPETRDDVRVTLWDAEDETVLRTVIVAVEEHKLTTHAIDPLQLEADHEYMITFNASTWYDYRRPSEELVTYPFTAGPITITGYGYADGTTQVMPTVFPRQYYAGDLTFTFKPGN